MKNFLEKYRNAANSNDRVDTGLKDINGKNIKVGDVLVDKEDKVHYFINYLPQRNIFYGIAEGNKILHQEDFSQYEDKYIAIPNSVFN